MSDDGDEFATVPQTQAHGRKEGGDAAFQVTVVDGPDRGLSRLIDASVGAALVGQSPSCELRLQDRRVSRRHLELEVSGRRLRVRDAGSTNGTRIGGLAIAEAFLEGGELVTLGETVLQIERRRGVAPAIHAAPAAASFGRVFGISREMRRLYPMFTKLAATTTPVILEGETGTGKELAAEAIHEASARAAGPFVVLDCAAMSPLTIESELFGHEPGAFPGATAARRGVFEEADGGTLFIDEVGELDMAVQARLLRAVERAEVRRIGGNRWIHVDVRVITATRRDLDREIERGTFRDDLYHRLAGARVVLPPLRQRSGDVAFLARRFAAELGASDDALSDALVERWELAPWPGNVRELRNAVAHQLVVGDMSNEPDAPDRDDVTARANPLFERVLAERLPLTVARQRIVDAFERRYLEKTLADHGGNVMRAAAAAGVARRYFQLLRARKLAP